MGTLGHDLRYAFRSLRRAPGFTIVALSTLALGIGAATAVYTLIQGVLLSPLPYPEADRLVLIRQQNPSYEWNTSVVDFQAVAHLNRSFDAVAAMQPLDVMLTGDERPEWVSARWVTADYFRVMGVAPARGRGFVWGEDQPGAPRAVVVGHAFTERHFGPQIDPIGRTLMLDGLAHTIIGVMPPDSEELSGMRADLWPILQLGEPERRGPFFLSTLARLEPGATLEQAADDLARISRRIFPQWQAGFQDETARLVPRPLQDAVVGEAATALWIAFGAVLVLLLIATVNIANLVLMRITERARELGVRAALGASRRRLACLLITEGLAVAGLGGLAGIWLAALLLELYRSLGPALPRLAEVTMDMRVAGFAALAALVSGTIFGTAPLWFGGVGGRALAPHHTRGIGESRGRQRARNGLVACEFALTLPLLAAAGLLVNSLVRLQRVDPGFDADHLLTVRLALPETSYPEVEDRLAFWERALPELRQIPGVLALGLAAQLPPSCGCYNNFDLVGRPAEASMEPQSPWIPVTTGFFAALDVPLREGRGFDARERLGSPPVVLVSETWAERYFPGESAVGRRLYEGGDRSEPVTVVGVVADVKFDGLDRPGEGVYAPISQGWPNNPVYLVVRTGPQPLALAEPLRAALRRLEPALVPSEVAPMDSRLRDALAGERNWAAVIAGFAFAALLLSAVGVFGVLSYAVSRQVREIGIRLAVGADTRHIARLVLWRGLGSALGGTAVGIVLALFAGRGLESLLFEVERTDPLTLIGASILLLAIALAACWLPARRATRVDPMAALKEA